MRKATAGAVPSEEQLQHGGGRFGGLVGDGEPGELFVGGDGLAQEAEMRAAQGLGVVVAQMGEQLGRPHQVGEEKGDHSALAHADILAIPPRTARAGQR